MCVVTRWFKYDRDYLCVNKSQFVPVIFEPPCTDEHFLPYRTGKHCTSSRIPDRVFNGCCSEYVVLWKYLHDSCLKSDLENSNLKLYCINLFLDMWFGPCEGKSVSNKASTHVYAHTRKRKHRFRRITFHPRIVRVIKDTRFISWPLWLANNWKPFGDRSTGEWR